jgi:hypothetical protein
VALAKALAAPRVLARLDLGGNPLSAKAIVALVAAAARQPAPPPPARSP